MARGKVQMRRIENPVHRQVTFCKRRAGLLKKAQELSVLCDAEIGLVIFSARGKIYELATRGTMRGLIERYIRSKGDSVVATSEGRQQPQEAENEISVLKKEIEELQNGLRCMIGQSTGNMTLDELQALERHLDLWICHIRSAKVKINIPAIMFQEIQVLKNKEGLLKAANEFLQEMIIDQSGHFDPSPVLADFPYPLTIENEIFPF